MFEKLRSTGAALCAKVRAASRKTTAAVFTPEEVHSLNEFQAWGMMHPFTCGSGHRTEHPDGEGLLVATTHGWVCPYCDYRQNWAHAWMKNGDWKKSGTYKIEILLRERARRITESHDELVAALRALTVVFEHLVKVVKEALPEDPLPLLQVLDGAKKVLARLKAKGLLPEEKASAFRVQGPDTDAANSADSRTQP